MAVYEVFSHSELRRYKTHICTQASLLIVVVLFLTVIPPLFVVYRSHGFWKKEEYFRESPDVQFKKQLLLSVDLQDGSFLTYSTFQKYNQLQQQHIRVPLIKSREEDTNRDGRADKLLFDLELPLQDTEEVVGLKLLLFFDYKIYKFPTLQMESMAYIQHDSVRPGARYDVTGELRIKQREPLAHKGVDSRYNVSIIDGSSVYAETFDLMTIFKNYIERNVTTVLDAPYSVWLSGRGASQPFVISATIYYPEEVYLYTPGFWYMIKWGWVQYVSVLLLFIFVFDRIKIFIFQNQLVPTITEKAWKEEKMS